MKHILLFFFLASMAWLTAIELTLKPTVKIEGENIYVEDVIFPITDKNNIDDYMRIKDTKIGEIKAPVKFKNILGRDIQFKLQTVFPDLKTVIKGQVISVYRTDKPLMDYTAESDLKRFLKDFFKLSDKAEIKILTFPDIQIDNQNISYRFSIPESQPQTGTVLVRAQLLKNGQSIRDFAVNVNIIENYSVYRLTRSMRKGELISENDVMKSELFDMAGKKYFSNGNPVGMITKNYLPKGRIIKDNDISTEPDVYRSDLVNVVIKGENYELSYQALAKKDGWKGDRIPVQNPDTRQYFTAVVIAKNTVLINLED